MMDILKKKTQISADKANLQKKISLVNNLKDIAIVVIDENDVICKMNKEFKAMFAQESSAGTGWDTFMFNNFTRAGKSDEANIYILKNDVNNRYILESSFDQSTGYRYCWFYKIPTTVLNTVSAQRSESLKSKKLDIFNLIEDSIYKKSIYWNNSEIKLRDIEYADEGNLYSNQEDAQVLIQDYIELIYSFLNLKQNNSSCEISMRRKFRGGDLVVVADFTNCNYSAIDFQNDFKWNGRNIKLKEICRELENRLTELKVSVAFGVEKVSFISDFRLELIISDMDGVRWSSKF